MTYPTQLQKNAREHNWNLYKISGIRQNLVSMATSKTLTEESRCILHDLIDHIDLLTTSMKIRKDMR